LQRWTRDKSLSFVPPDGRFTIFDYRFSPAPALQNVSEAGDKAIPVPFVIKATIDVVESTREYSSSSIIHYLNQDKNWAVSINIALTSRHTTPIENVAVEMNLESTAGGLKFTAAGGGGVGVGGGGIGMGSGGGEGGSGPGTSWRFDPKKRVGLITSIHTLISNGGIGATLGDPQSVPVK
jgi:AP-3 complex subunit mu